MSPQSYLSEKLKPMAFVHTILQGRRSSGCCCQGPRGARGFLSPSAPGKAGGGHQASVVLPGSDGSRACAVACGEGAGRRACAVACSPRDAGSGAARSPRDAGSGAARSPRDAGRERWLACSSRRARSGSRPACVRRRVRRAVSERAGRARGGCGVGH